MRVVQYAAICIFAGLIVWKGLLPAFSQLDTDFPNYYTSSRLLLDGKDLSRLYDDRWFQEQMSSYGISQEGKFSPFPPVTAFLMAPVAVFDPLTALRVWTVLNILVLGALIVILSAITGNDWRWSSLLVLGSGIALINNFRMGQWYLALLLLMAGGWYLYQRKHFLASGILFGIGAAFKYFPVLFLGVFLLQKEWRGAIALAATVALVYGAGILALGWQLHYEFFTQVLRPHVGGNIQDPFSANLESWNSLLRKFFVYDPLLNASPILHSNEVFVFMLSLVIAAAVGAACWALYRSRLNTGPRPEHEDLQAALIMLTGMLLLPASATYHFLLLILPVGLFLRRADFRNIWEKILVITYLTIGFLPYRFFRVFEGKQYLTVLAFPRLWVMTVMFIAGCCYVASLSRRSVRPDAVFV
ncbi:MAG TPA: glycosyltransferase family 87 protein [Bacteroidota bacterium]|jgi:hypothetical protein|nr:glycosyltransferase family 87 protein [Bacteroidota bacterium]